MAHRKQGYRFEDDWPPHDQEYVFKNYKEAVTIPVNVEIEGDHIVLNLDNVKEILCKADLISLMDCGCRTKRLSGYERGCGESHQYGLGKGDHLG